jgi:hypothetical protein
LSSGQWKAELRALLRMESGFDLRVEKFSDAWEHTHLRVPRTGAAA